MKMVCTATYRFNQLYILTVKVLTFMSVEHNPKDLSWQQLHKLCHSYYQRHLFWKIYSQQGRRGVGVDFIKSKSSVLVGNSTADRRAGNKISGIAWSLEPLSVLVCSDAGFQWGLGVWSSACDARLEGRLKMASVTSQTSVHPHSWLNISFLPGWPKMNLMMRPQSASLRCWRWTGRWSIYGNSWAQVPHSGFCT